MASSAVFVDSRPMGARLPMNDLFARALVAFLVLPGVVAFLVPLLRVGADTTAFSNWWGAIPLGIGIAALIACVREFYVAGRGTLAPWAPTRVAPGDGRCHDEAAAGERQRHGAVEPFLPLFN
jgi:hypothetical protein